MTISGKQRFLKKCDRQIWRRNWKNFGKELWQRNFGRNYWKIPSKFAEDPLEIHPKDSNDESYFPGESINIASANSKNDNSKNNNYSNILSDKRFTDEHVNSDDPNKIASDNKITINSIGHP